MFASILYFLLALLGLGFLIFIHELGHYFMAKRVGMRVETFAIGFGSPFFSWERNGTKWQVGWLLFGGFVKIKGTEMSGERDPYSIPDGFFGRPPFQRILVSAMGPLVNLFFAFLAFAVLWSLGGREQSFSQHTHKIGWIDPHSTLYSQGIRPGDEITAYNGRPYVSSADHMQMPMMSGGHMIVDGYKVNYVTKERIPFSVAIETYPNPLIANREIATTGILAPANYIIYDKLPDGEDNKLHENSPLLKSGIEYGDRIVWVDGEVIFSSQQLSHLLNDHRALVTIMRRGKPILRRVPRVAVRELKLDPGVKSELSDWQFEAHLNNQRFQDLYVLPYNLTPDGIVEGPLKFIDSDSEMAARPKALFSPEQEPLQEGDKIIAIDGTPTALAHQILPLLQKHRVLIIAAKTQSISYDEQSENADSTFDDALDIEALAKISSSIGTSKPITKVDDYRLLAPIEPKSREIYLKGSQESKAYATILAEQQRAIEAITDPENRAAARKQLEEQQSELFLGLPNVQDKKIWYNPNPVEMFGVVCSEVVHTLSALFSGSLNLKWISGPVGIVQMVHSHSMNSLHSALFWLGAVSLNLGLLNLLPIPVLDGGSILFALFEMITGKRLSPKTMDLLIVPFALLLIAFFVFVTFNDVSRLFKGFW